MGAIVSAAKNDSKRSLKTMLQATPVRKKVVLGVTIMCVITAAVGGAGLAAANGKVNAPVAEAGSLPTQETILDVIPDPKVPTPAETTAPTPSASMAEAATSETANGAPNAPDESSTIHIDGGEAAIGTNAVVPAATGDTSPNASVTAPAPAAGRVAPAPVAAAPAPAPVAAAPVVVAPVSFPAQSLASINRLRVSAGVPGFVAPTAGCSYAGQAWGDNLDGAKGTAQHTETTLRQAGLHRTGASYVPDGSGRYGTLTIYNCG